MFFACFGGLALRQKRTKVIKRNDENGYDYLYGVPVEQFGYCAGGFVSDMFPDPRGVLEKVGIRLQMRCAVGICCLGVGRKHLFFRICSLFSILIFQSKITQAKR